MHCNSIFFKTRKQKHLAQFTTLRQEITDFLKKYFQGISIPRSHDIAGGDLPSPRLISMRVFSDEDRPLGEVTSLLMQFGQFINHDMESTSTYTFRKFNLKLSEHMVC